MRMKFGSNRGYGLLAVAAVLVLSAPASAQHWPDIGEVKAIAEEGYV